MNNSETLKLIELKLEVKQLATKLLILYSLYREHMDDVTAVIHTSLHECYNSAFDICKNKGYVTRYDPILPSPSFNRSKYKSSQILIDALSSESTARYTNDVAGCETLIFIYQQLIKCFP